MIHTWLLAKGGGINRSFPLLLLLPLTVPGDTLGFVAQKFSYLSFEKGKWDRAAQLPCYVYSARQDDAVAEMLRIGASNLVPFKAAKGLTVTVCGDTATFDEGFEAGAPSPNKTVHK